MNNKPHSQETKDKIRKSLMGRNKGVKRNPEIGIKISNSRKGIPPWNKGFCGEKASNWQGGKSSKNMLIRRTIEYKLWRKAVFYRDNYTCIWCGSKTDIEADHIKPFAKFPELRFAIDNGRTLCHDCHKTTETYGAKTR